MGLEWVARAEAQGGSDEGVFRMFFALIGWTAYLHTQVENEVDVGSGLQLGVLEHLHVTSGVP